MPGLQPGGWMERLKDAGLDPAEPNFTKLAPEDVEIAAQAKQAAAVKKPKLVMTKTGVDRKITRAELEEHNKEEEPWFVVNNEVYDGTGFLSDHPGGAESITLVAGEDCSDDFMAIRAFSSAFCASSSSIYKLTRPSLTDSVDAKLRLTEFHIGTLVDGEGTPASAAAVEAAPTVFDPEAIFLDKKKWKGAQLVSIGTLLSLLACVESQLTRLPPS